MLQDLALGLRQLGDPAAQRLLVRCVVIALLTFVVLIGAVGTLLGLLDLTGWAWLDTSIAVAGSAATLVLAWLLFPAAIGATLGLFADEVAGAVERRYYPKLPPPRSVGFGEGTLAALRFASLAILLNLLALPVYFFPGLNVPVYLALNGYLLGREYFELIALRRLPAAEVAQLRRSSRGRWWPAGVVIAGMLAVPVFNLVAPVVAIGFMVHRFHRWRGRAAPGGRTATRAALEVRPTGDRNV